MLGTKFQGHGIDNANLPLVYMTLFYFLERVFKNLLADCIVQLNFLKSTFLSIFGFHKVFFGVQFAIKGFADSDLP